MAEARGAAASLREELERLDSAGLLRRVDREVDPRFEICAVASVGAEEPMLFEHVRGADLPVVINTLSSRAALAVSFGVDPSEVGEKYLDALQNPIAPVVVGQAPVQEVIRRGDEVDLLSLPILTHHEDDAGPYITTGVAIAEDPARGIRNLSYHRMHVRSAREAGMVIVQRHLHQIVDSFEEDGKPTPVAIVIGLDSATRLAAATSGSSSPFGFDELSLAGALHGRAVPMVPCVSIPVHVPADAEIVIEGEILPGRQDPEGPFAEFDGSYESGTAHVFRATALTMRRNPIYQGLRSGSIEQLNIMGLPNEPLILRSVRSVVPTARAVHVTTGGLRKFHAVVSLDKRHEGDGPDAIVAAFAGQRDLKLVVVVDADVSPFDPDAVEQALATRFQPARDTVIVNGGRANGVDRSVGPDGTTSRMGLDATAPLGQREDPKAAVIPGRDAVTLDDYLR